MISYKIYISAKPTAIVRPSSLTVLRGGSVVLLCNTQTLKGTTVRWTSNNGSLPANYIANNTHLILRRLTTDIIPICTVSNGAGQASANSSITINGRKFYLEIHST